MMVRDRVWLMAWSSVMSEAWRRFFSKRLADAVEHDDGVVQRVADDREDGRDHRQVERRLREREHAEHQDRVVHHGEDGAERQSPGVEAQDDVERDQHQRHRQRLDGRVAQLVADLRTHDCEVGDPAPADRRWPRIFSNFGRSTSAVSPVVCRRMVTSRVLNRRSAPAARGTPPASTAVRIFSMLASCGKVDFDADAAGEVDGEVQSAHEERHERSDHQDGRQRVPHLACGHEREVGFLMKKFHGLPQVLNRSPVW